MEDARKHLEIDQTQLDEELSKQAARYLFVAEQAVNAELQYETFKAQMGQLEASLDCKVRSAAEAAGKKTTETSIRNQIELDPNYQKAVKTLVELRARREALKALREAYYQRKDCLIQLAIKARSEIETMLSETVKGRAA